MRDKKMKVKPFFSVTECDCGGVFKERAKSGVNYLSHPPQASFICNKCRKETLLFEAQWPKIQYEILEEEIE